MTIGVKEKMENLWNHYFYLFVMIWNYLKNYIKKYKENREVLEVLELLKKEINEKYNGDFKKMYINLKEKDGE